MDRKLTLELNDETVIKLEKLAHESGISLDELINRSLVGMLNEAQSSGS